MKQLLQEARSLFDGWEILIILSLWFVGNFSYFFYVSKNINVSLMVGAVGMLFFFVVFTMENIKLKKYQFHLNELMKYVTNTVFYLQTGENVLYALEYAKESVHPDIRKEIEKSIRSLREGAELQTKHFEKYDFPTLDQFHKHLKIYYEAGGNPTEMFEQIQENMLSELKRRDELYRKRKGFAKNYYQLIGIVATMPAFLRLMIGEVWDVFLMIDYNGMVVSIAILLTVYFMFLGSLFLLQKYTTDISVRI